MIGLLRLSQFTHWHLLGWRAWLAVALVVPAFQSAANAGENEVIAPRAVETLVVPVEGAGTKRALILCGHPGDKEHRKLFAETVEKLQKALIERQGFATDEVRIQFGGKVAEGDGPVLSGVRGQATREEIEAEVASLKERLKPEDTLWVIVIGHSHYDGRHSYLNLPGPDLHEREFGKLFEGVVCREQVFFITTPASGYYLKPLAAKGRIVITATEADLEVNETLFPHALAEVLATPPAADVFDADKDGAVTLFDLYIAVNRNIVGRYITEAEKLIPTEHAQLDDNGDGRGTELQINYLTVEQGGRVKDGFSPPMIKETADGAASSRMLLPAK